MFEIAGELADFADTVERIDGLEWLAEQLDVDPSDPTEDFARVDDRGRRKPFRRELFVLASDAQAWAELVRYWEVFRSGRDLPRGLAPLRQLFERLIALREWDDRDRLLRAGAAEVWRANLTDLGPQSVPFELELWLRRDEERRAAIVSQLREDLEAIGGTIEHEAVVDAIQYHGVLGTAPAELLVDAASREEVRWLSTQGVRLFHPIGQMAAPTPDERELGSREDLSAGDPSSERIRVALLDGLPVANHEAIRGRVAIDDPEDWASTVGVAERLHGTAMASLATRGDLSDSGAEPLTERVYLRPILRPDAPSWVERAGERVPADRLPVDFIHTVVRRILADPDPAAPEVQVIGLSIGDSAQQFDRFVSPLARLLDWLSFEHRVLFLVSAGNHVAPLLVGGDANLANPAELQHEVLDARRKDALSRRLLCPAESINAVAVGAAHADGSGYFLADDRLEGVTRSDLPSVISPVASGVRRSIKPETLYPGGRQLLRARPGGGGDGAIELEVATSTRAPGVGVAAPDPGGRLDATAHMCGTSAANALAVRAAARLLQATDEFRAEWGDRAPSEALDPVLVKALLVHSARWGEASTVIQHVLAEAGESAGKEAIARFLGYGTAQPEWVAVCDDHRVTLIQAALIGEEDAHEFSMPVPAALTGSTVRRRLTATLAWLTPINPLHRNYRRAALTLDLPADRNGVFGTRSEVSANAARRGTVQHEHLVGTRAVPHVEGATESLVVSCRADAGTLADQIPYALVVTVEVSPDQGIAIYQQIRDRLRARVPVRP